jgi:hypothetical protein
MDFLKILLNRDISDTPLSGTCLLNRDIAGIRMLFWLIEHPGARLCPPALVREKRVRCGQKFRKRQNKLCSLKPAPYPEQAPILTPLSPKLAYQEELWCYSSSSKTPMLS